MVIELDAKRIKTTAYADDVAVLVRGKYLDVITDILETTIKDIKIWTKSKGLNGNPSKTEIVLFTIKRKIEAAREIVIDEVEIPRKAKYLGIILFRKLTWNPNLEERRKKALVD